MASLPPFFSTKVQGLSDVGELRLELGWAVSELAKCVGSLLQHRHLDKIPSSM